MNISTARKETLAAWWQAARPPFYIATLVPVVLGYVAAGKDTGIWDGFGLAGIMLICFFQHLAANLSNDLFDHMLGVDDGDAIGGSRVIQQGKITPFQLVIALLLIFMGTIICSAIGIYYFGLPKLWFVVGFAIFSSLFYVAPPIKYGHRALGEVFVFLNMGFAMTVGTYYALTGDVTFRIVALSVPVGLMVAGILYFQSIPEIVTDKLAGKNTLANTLGPIKAKDCFYAWWIVIWVVLLLLWAVGFCSWYVLLGIGASVPFYMMARRKVQAIGDNWLDLDQHGHLVRKMYLFLGLSLIFAVALQ